MRVIIFGIFIVISVFIIQLSSADLQYGPLPNERVPRSPDDGSVKLDASDNGGKLDFGYTNDDGLKIDLGVNTDDWSHFNPTGSIKFDFGK